MITTKDHIENLNALRAFAVFSVFVSHMASYGGIKFPILDEHGGGIGVQTFFLISGYLITQSAQNKTLFDYSISRFFRVFPAYWIALITAWILTASINNEYLSLLKENKSIIILNLLNLQQFSIKSLLMFDSLHVSWTLTVELIWYCIAFILATTLRFINLPYKWVFLLIITTVFSLLWVISAERGNLDFLLQNQTEASGVLISAPIRHVFLKSNIIGYLYFFIVGATIFIYKNTLISKPNFILWMPAALTIFLWENTQTWIGFAPQPLAAIGLGCLLILFLKMPPIKDNLINYTGEISYSIYLTHAPVMILIYHLLQINGVIANICVIALTYITSTVMFNFIEKPMIDYGRKIINKHRKIQSNTQGK